MELDRVLQGDCLDRLKETPDGSVSLAFADPPFNIGYQYDSYDDRKERKFYLDWTRRWTAEVVRTLTPDGAVWLAIGDEYAAELKLILQDDHGLTCRSWVVWYYTFGVHCERKFTRSHAHIFHFVRDPNRFTFNADAIRVPSARQLVYADRRANPKGRVPDDTWVLRPQDMPEGYQPNEDTWYFPRVNGTF
ncbi:MAG TPA: DNA methyltransferase, partial [Pirellulales bacterium]